MSYLPMHSRARGHGDRVSAYISAYTYEVGQCRLDDTVYMRARVYVCAYVCVQVGGSCQGNSILRA